MHDTKTLADLARQAGDPGCSALAARDDARANVRTLWAMLRRVQWVDGWCPVCEHHRTNGHRPDCELARQLRVPHVW